MARKLLFHGMPLVAHLSTYRNGGLLVSLDDPTGTPIARLSCEYSEPDELEPTEFVLDETVPAELVEKGVKLGWFSDTEKRTEIGSFRVFEWTRDDPQRVIVLRSIREEMETITESPRAPTIAELRSRVHAVFSARSARGIEILEDTVSAYEEAVTQLRERLADSSDFRDGVITRHELHAAEACLHLARMLEKALRERP